MEMGSASLTYDGIKGSAKYSKEDDVWHGKILGTNDLVTYSAETLEQLKKEFVAAVEDWRKTRKELGWD